MEYSKIKFNLIILCIKSSKLSKRMKEMLIKYVKELNKDIEKKG